MTPAIPQLDGPWWPYLALLMIAVLPTEIWRWVAVVFARRFEEDSPAQDFVRMFALAMLAAVLAKIIIAPSGILAVTPLPLRLAATAAPVLLLIVWRRAIFPAVLLGEAILIGGGWWLTGG